MSFAVYALAVLSNLLVVYVLPDAQVREFLKAYSTASMVIGLAVVYAFSIPRLMPALQAARLPLCATLAGLSLFAGSGTVVATVYAGALLLSDYYISQCGRSAHVQAYRWFLVFSVLPALPEWSLYREYLVLLRICGSLLMVAALSLGSRPLEALKIGNPFFYILATHALYFGSLTIVSWTVSTHALRAWYVGAQVGQGLVLKLLDYKTRSVSSSTHRYQLAIHLTTFAIAAGLVAYSWQPWALIAYATSVLLLNLVARRERMR